MKFFLKKDKSMDLDPISKYMSEIQSTPIGFWDIELKQKVFVRRETPKYIFWLGVN
jgi:hypothetical protein